MIFYVFPSKFHHMSSESFHKLQTDLIHFAYAQLPSFHRTKRVWKPNVVKKKYYSQILEQTMRFEFSTHALRCIDKAGGFDNYIINTKDKWLHSRAAIDLKRLMLEVLKCKNQTCSHSKDIHHQILLWLERTSKTSSFLLRVLAIIIILFLVLKYSLSILYNLYCRCNFLFLKQVLTIVLFGSTDNDKTLPGFQWKSDIPCNLVSSFEYYVYIFYFNIQAIYDKGVHC